MSQIVRVTLFQTYWAQSVQNVLHFKHIPESFDPVAIKNEMVAGWIPIVGQLQNAQLSYVGVAVKKLDSPGTITDNYAVSIAGTSFSLAYSLSFPALLLSLRTADGTRAGRGRVYIAGLPGAGYDSGRFNSGTLTAINTVVGQLVARYLPGGASDLELVVRGRGSEAAAKSVTAILPRSIPAVQRRRNLGTGI